MPRVTLKQIRQGIKEGITLFFVHASWCPYTVQFYPIFETVMNNLKKKELHKKFDVIKLDDIMTRSIRANYGDIYKQLADYDSDTDEYKLYFPSVVMFVNGKRYKYKVDVRTVANFEAFITSKLRTPTRRQKNVNEMRNQKERENVEQRNIKGRTFSRNITTTRPVKFLTLEQQINKAFQKLFKEK